MEGIDLHGIVTHLASATSKDGTENTNLKMIDFPWRIAENWVLHNSGFYVVDHSLMDCDGSCWNLVFNDLKSAVACFGEEANRKRKSGGRIYGKVKWTDNWKYYRTELLPDRSYV